MCEGLGVKVAGFKVQGLLRSSWDLVIGVISKVTGLRTAKHPIKGTTLLTKSHETLK